jgi:hypothetical protein
MTLPYLPLYQDSLILSLSLSLSSSLSLLIFLSRPNLSQFYVIVYPLSLSSHILCQFYSTYYIPISDLIHSSFSVCTTTDVQRIYTTIHADIVFIYILTPVCLLLLLSYFSFSFSLTRYIPLNFPI